MARIEHRIRRHPRPADTVNPGCKPPRQERFHRRAIVHSAGRRPTATARNLQQRSFTATPVDHKANSGTRPLTTAIDTGPTRRVPPGSACGPTTASAAARVPCARTKPPTNRVARALRMAAQTLQHAENELGDHSRRLRAKLGGPAAVPPPSPTNSLASFTSSSPPVNLASAISTMPRSANSTAPAPSPASKPRPKTSASTSSQCPP